MTLHDVGRYCLYACPFLAALFLGLWIKARIEARLMMTAWFLKRTRMDGETERDLEEARAEAAKARNAYEALVNAPLQTCPRPGCGAETKLVTICPVCQVEGCVERCVPRGGPCVQCAREGATVDSDDDHAIQDDSVDDPRSGESTTRKGPQRPQL